MSCTLLTFCISWYSSSAEGSLPGSTIYYHGNSSVLINRSHGYSWGLLKHVSVATGTKPAHFLPQWKSAWPLPQKLPYLVFEFSSPRHVHAASMLSIQHPTHTSALIIKPIDLAHAHIMHQPSIAFPCNRLLVVSVCRQITPPRTCDIIHGQSTHEYGEGSTHHTNKQSHEYQQRPSPAR